MRRQCCVFLVLLFLYGLMNTATAQVVGSSGEQESGFYLEQNYPNPFNPETKIPFILNEDLFDDGGSVVVTVRIFNVLQQFIATPTALNHPRGEAVPVIDLEYASPGRFETYWDGRDQAGRHVASGVYFVQLVVDGRSDVRKMFVAK